MTVANHSPWVVLKFGGTSVSSVTNWQNIARVVQARLANGLRPVIVHSALSGITDLPGNIADCSDDGRSTHLSWRRSSNAIGIWPRSSASLLAPISNVISRS